MKRLLHAAISLVLVAPWLGASECTAQGPIPPGPDFHGVYGPHHFDHGPPETAFIEVPFNNSNLYPSGGWTLYPGLPGSFAPSMSNYSHINGLVHPAISAKSVLAKLHHMGIPIVPPEPQFYCKNPCAGDHINLPVPKKWLPKEKEETKEEPKEDSKNDKDDKDNKDNKKMDKDDKDNKNEPKKMDKDDKDNKEKKKKSDEDKDDPKKDKDDPKKDKTEPKKMDKADND